MKTKRSILSLLAITLAALVIGGALAQAPLKVGVYGGYFKDAFDEHIFPRFTEDTGIQVESVAEPTGEAWYAQLEVAARAGQAPADVSMMTQESTLRGIVSGLWLTLDESALPNLQYVRPQLIARNPEGELKGVGAVSWYITLVSNTEQIPDEPNSWADMWEEERRGQLGLLSRPSNSFLLEITAETFFGGTDILNTEDGIRQVVDKLAEIKPNVQLWYRDEGQFQQALQAGEIPMGQYYHDVAGLAAAEGFPVRSTFPMEGAVLDSGNWVVSRASKRLEDSQVFINWFSQPEIQSLVARTVGTSPSVEREHLDLSDDEFAAVSSEITPIVPRYDLHFEKSDFIDRLWTERITN
jgi:putative spermidine/putrescine transport system substrate-binding protein